MGISFIFRKQDMYVVEQGKHDKNLFYTTNKTTSDAGKKSCLMIRRVWAWLASATAEATATSHG